MLNNSSNTGPDWKKKAADRNLEDGLFDWMVLVADNTHEDGG